MAHRPTPEEIDAQIDAWVARSVATAPAPSDELIRTLSRLLHPPVELSHRGLPEPPQTPAGPAASARRPGAARAAARRTA
jgi:hypothetical protein